MKDLEKLIRHTGDKHDFIRIETFKALDEIVKSIVDQRVLKKIAYACIRGTRDKHERVRQIAFSALSKIAQNTSDQQLLGRITQVCTEGLVDKDFSVRENARSTLREILKNTDSQLKDKLIDEIIGKIEYKYRLGRMGTFKALSEIAKNIVDQRVLKKIAYACIRGTRDKHEGVRESAFYALSETAPKISDPQVLERIVGTIIRGTEDENQWFRRYAFIVLGKIAQNTQDKQLLERITDACIRGTEDEIWVVREEAFSSLGEIARNTSDPQLSEQIIDAIIRGTEDYDLIVRKKASEVLSQMNSTYVKDFFSIISAFAECQREAIIFLEADLFEEWENIEWPDKINGVVNPVGFLFRLLTDEQSAKVLAEYYQQLRSLRFVIENGEKIEEYVREVLSVLLNPRQVNEKDKKYFDRYGETLEKVSRQHAKYLIMIVNYLSKNVRSEPVKLYFSDRGILSDHRDVFKPKKEQRTNKKFKPISSR